jgi:hypothetical protein
MSPRPFMVIAGAVVSELKLKLAPRPHASKFGGLLASLHGDTRFAAILRKMQLPK